MQTAHTHAGNSGFSLTELLISVSLSAVLAAVLAVGLSSIHRCFSSSESHASSRGKQLRIIDYVSRDLRRALTVQQRPDGGLDLTIPNFYESANPGDRKPHMPRVVGGTIRYGDSDIPVRYYKRGAHVYRNYNGVETLLAADVRDFVLTPEIETAHVALRISFAPRYRWNGDQTTARDGTSVYARTLLRNLRS